MFSFCGCINCPLHNMHLQNVNIWPHDLRPLLHLLLQQIQPFCGQCTWGFGATKMPKRDFLNNALFIDVFHDQNMLKEKLNDQFNRILFIFKMSLIQLRSWILILWHNNQIVVSKKYAIIKLDHHLPGLKIPPKQIWLNSFHPPFGFVEFPEPKGLMPMQGTLVIWGAARNRVAVPFDRAGVCYKNSIKGL